MAEPETKADWYWLALPCYEGDNLSPTKLHGYATLLVSPAEWARLQHISQYKARLWAEPGCCGQEQCLACTYGGLGLGIDQARAIALTKPEQVKLCIQQQEVIGQSGLNRWARNIIDKQFSACERLAKQITERLQQRHSWLTWQWRDTFPVDHKRQLARANDELAKVAVELIDAMITDYGDDFGDIDALSNSDPELAELNGKRHYSNAHGGLSLSPWFADCAGGVVAHTSTTPKVLPFNPDADATAGLGDDKAINIKLTDQQRQWLILVIKAMTRVEPLAPVPGPTTLASETTKSKLPGAATIA